MFVFGVLLLLPFVAAKCPAGATEAYNQCYVPSFVVATWSAAEGICQNMGGHLAKVDNADQNAFLLKLLHDQWIFRAWISPNTASGSWLNSDGSALVYNNFQKSPGNSWELTAALIDGQSGVWTEQMGTFVNKFICQFPTCGSDGSMPPSILPKNNDTGVIYSEVSNSFFYTTAFQTAQISMVESWCSAIGGHLPAVSNSFQNQELLQIIDDVDSYGNDNKYALGLYSDFKSVWHWTDGRSTGFANWAANVDPSLPNQRSLFDKKSGKWVTSTDIAATFICQFAIDNRKC